MIRIRLMLWKNPKDLQLNHYIYKKSYSTNNQLRFNLFSNSNNTKISETGIREEEIRNALNNIIEPYSKKSIVSINAVQSIRVYNEIPKRIQVDLEMFVPGYPLKNEIIKLCSEEIYKLSWLLSKSNEEILPIVDIKILNKRPHSASASLGSSLARVEHIIAVSSCKGGVGKSTIAVNFALTLAKRGLRVGLLDADVYGPSLPSMIQAIDNNVHKSQENPKFILPLIGPYNLKMLSFGHVNPKSGAPGSGGYGAAVMRGPVATKVVNQLIGSTQWGELDYLIVDMPPGTGDIQITLCQSMSLSGSVIVTTPHILSLVDVAKGISMFEDLKVPILSIVENMSYFTSKQGDKYYPFGKGGIDNIIRGMSLYQSKLAQSQIIERDNSSHSSKTNLQKNNSFTDASTYLVEKIKACPLHCFPLSSENSGASETSNSAFEPVVLSHPDSSDSIIYQSLADDVIKEIFKLQIGKELLPSISYLESQKVVVMRYFTSDSVTEYIIPIKDLRTRDTKTGDILKDKGDINLDNIKPIKFEIKGNYGVSIIWNDGFYADIFPFEILKSISKICNEGLRSN